MKNPSISNSSQFDQYIDEGGDVTSYIVPTSVKRRGLEQKRVNIDFPGWAIKSLDLKATRVDVNRQSLIKMCITENTKTKYTHYKRIDYRKSFRVSKRSYGKIIYRRHFCVPHPEGSAGRGQLRFSSRLYNASTICSPASR